MPLTQTDLVKGLFKLVKNLETVLLYYFKFMQCSM